MDAQEARQLSSTSILKETPVQVNENKELSVVHVAEIPLTNKSATLSYYMHVLKSSQCQSKKNDILNILILSQKFMAKRDSKRQYHHHIIIGSTIDSIFRGHPL